jgi:hypothetical protein
MAPLWRRDFPHHPVQEVAGKSVSQAHVDIRLVSVIDMAQQQALEAVSVQQEAAKEAGALAEEVEVEAAVVLASSLVPREMRQFQPEDLRIDLHFQVYLHHLMTMTSRPSYS